LNGPALSRQRQLSECRHKAAGGAGGFGGV